MVGKPNLPSNCDDRVELMGASMPSPGLCALDQERQASMADEGGASGAYLESPEGQGFINETHSITMETIPSRRLRGPRAMRRVAGGLRKARAPLARSAERFPMAGFVVGITLGVLGATLFTRKRAY